jgi:hypothetical protein
MKRIIRILGGRRMDGRSIQMVIILTVAAKMK